MSKADPGSSDASAQDPVGAQADQLTAALRDALGPDRARAAASAFAAGRSSSTHDEHVGHDAEQGSGQHAGVDACQVCPICRAIRLATSINPDTIDQVADLVSMGADLLRGLAEQGRERRAERQAGERGEPAPDEPADQDRPDADAKPAKRRTPAKNQARQPTKEST